MRVKMLIGRSVTDDELEVLTAREVSDGYYWEWNEHKESVLYSVGDDYRRTEVVEIELEDSVLESILPPESESVVFRPEVIHRRPEEDGSDNV